MSFKISEKKLSTEKRKKKKRHEQNLKDLWDTIIRAYAKCVPGVTKEEKDGVG